MSLGKSIHAMNPNTSKFVEFREKVNMGVKIGRIDHELQK